MNARVFLRSLHTAHWGLLARVPRRANPGMGYQLEGLKQQSVDASEDYADMESDFMSVHRTHRQHDAQLQQERHRVRQFMIKHKYFRDVKLPNLLLYAEKEQIRMLHQRDSEEWNLERLAESFPATADIVQKVLRSNWRPQSLQRILAHDAGVMRNWKLLRAGKCADIPADLLQHLQKFANREHHDLQQMTPEQWPTRPELPVPQRNEFRALLGDKGNKQTALPAPRPKDHPTQRPSEDDEDTYLLDTVKNKRKMRLQELKQLQLVPELQQELEQPLLNPSGTGALPSLVDKFERTEIVISVEDQRKYEMTKVKDQIVIPRKLYKAGATYRVEDVYYDDDGEFLYRVPGMTGTER